MTTTARKVEQMRQRIEKEVTQRVERELDAALDKLEKKLPAEEFERVLTILADDTDSEKKQ